MITLPPYEYDNRVYEQVPQVDRWILNKLHLAEAMGYLCGPIGTNPPEGRYCMRPMNSIRGLGSGGWFDITVDYGANQTIPLIPGYFWCEWFDGDNVFTHFIDDVAVHASRNPVAGGVMRSTGSTRFGTLTDAQVLPAFLLNKSKYLMLETLNDKVIDVAFRHMGMNARQEIIDDYKVIDPAYDPQDITMGNSDAHQQPYSVIDENGVQVDGLTWDDGNNNRRPFDT